MPANRLFDLAAEATPSPRSTSCISCGLYRDAKTPKMEPYGEGKRGLMIIGEAPGETEDNRGRPFVGKTGDLLRSTLKRLGVDLDRDCISTNAANCRPPANRTPTPHELTCCRTRYVHPSILRERPRVVLLLGGAATASIVGSLMTDVNDTITKWRGFRIPMPEWGCWLCPTFHPSFVARSEDKPEVATIWERDLESAIDQLRTPVPEPEDLRKRIVLLHTEDEILAALNRVHRGLFSFDYETTGLQPICHELVSASFATSPDRAFAFMYSGSERVREAWRNILASPRLGKAAHNIKFEDTWSREKFQVEDIEWRWDSMIAAHVVDNRPGICGLKLQVFLNFGVPSYDALIEPFLKSIDERDPTAPNRIYEFIERYGEDELLMYNGIDSLGGLRLAMQQMEILGAPDSKLKRYEV